MDTPQQPIPPFDDHAITDAMCAFGGNFVSGLGLLWRRADVENRSRLKAAFQEYWDSYSDPAMHAALAKRREV